ncbi:MAG: OmpH family outer membrane protein [Gemmatimonadetes bacterium]|jgi:outer membrane protein|nr:OmpH family outer membrane protein [Gemmatimonadota bacterium]
MIRTIVAGAVCVLAVSAAAPAPALAQARGAAQPAASAQATRFAFINSQKVLAEAPGAREAQQTFELDMSRYRTQIDSLEQDLERLRTEYDRQQATLSPAVRQQRQQDMQQRFAAYQQQVGQLEQTAQRRQAELVEPIMKRISDVIEQMRQEGRYAMIFDTSAGALITADPSLDLTDNVLARLRANPSR